MDKFWPGPLTIILEKKDIIPNVTSANLNTIGIRMPNCEIALKLIEISKRPIAAPSANISGCPSPTSANHVINDLDGKIDAVIMGDDSEVGVESTVVSLAGERPVLLRPGAVTLEQLREVLPDIVVDSAVLSEAKGDKVASPGMKYKHYSPKTTVYLV